MNKSILSIGLLILSSLFAKSQDTARILESTKVISASEAMIKEANERVAEIIQDHHKATPYFNHLLFIGPNLWGAIKDVDDFKKIKGGNVTFRVPKFEADGSSKKKTEVYGKVLQDSDAFNKLFYYLNNTFDLSKSQIVEKNATDKFLYWLCFAKLEEPLIAVQNDKARLIIQQKACCLLNYPSRHFLC